MSGSRARVACEVCRTLYGSKIAPCQPMLIPRTCMRLELQQVTMAFHVTNLVGGDKEGDLAASKGKI
jgi:hypothetical protein